jgi:hypothetical protein
MDAPHKAMHENGRSAMQAMQKGDMDKAISLLASTETASMLVLQALEKLAQAGEAIQ